MKNQLLLLLLLTTNCLISQDTYTFVNPNAGLDQDSIIQLYDERFGDINGDGLIDILEEEHYIPYLGGANFGDRVSLGLSQLAPPYLDIEDVNNDGYDDLANSSLWKENLGNNQFSATKSRPDLILYDAPSLPPTSTIVMSTGDYDGDGDGDRIGYSQLDYNFYLYENINNTHYLDRVLLADSDIAGGFFFPNQIREVRNDDFNNDGLIDVLVITHKKLIYFHNEGDMVFSTIGNLHDADFTITEWDIEDINLDGYLDVVLGTIRIFGGSAYGAITYYKGTDQGIISAQSIFSENVGDVKFGIKEDGTHGIYSTIESTIWEHIPNSNYTSFTRSDIVSGINGSNLVIRDVDSDGDIDFITHTGTKMGYYLKNEDITFESICPDSDVVITEQNDLIAYEIDYGNCRDLEYNLTISEDDNWMKSITSLEPLSKLETIAGDFSLNDIVNIDLEPFANLRHIKGDLNIHHFKVKDLFGFRNLEQIDGDINIDTAWPAGSSSVNIDYYDFNDLESFRKLGKGINIYNAAFANVDKIITDSIITGDLILWGTPSAGFPDLSNLDMIKEVTGSLFIGRADVNNDQISFKNLKHIGGDFTLTENDNLESLDFLNDQLIVTGNWRIDVNVINFILCESFALCNHISNGGSYDIYSDLISCFTENSENCDNLKITEEINNEKNVLTVFPIPSSTTLDISINNTKVDRVDYQIFNSQGFNVIHGNIENHSTISISDFRNGSYYMKAQGENSDEILVIPFVKM